MDQLLNQRLDILLDAGEISAEIKMVIMNFVHAFEKKYTLTMTEENASMFITHLAMALARIKRGEGVNPIDEAIINEVKQNKIYNELPQFYDQIEKDLDIVIPESEKGFIALHACTLLAKLGK